MTEKSLPARRRLAAALRHGETRSREETGLRGAYSQGRQENKESLQVLNGGFLFLGLFLGGMFLMITVLIIFYKQISEGYDDRGRFVIMEKVGMSR